MEQATIGCTDVSCQPETSIQSTERLKLIPEISKNNGLLAQNRSKFRREEGI
jgi:hypothetical protein